MLLSSPGRRSAPAALEPWVVGITADSRLVRPGFVFAAIAGSNADGARFIADAVKNGAVAVLAGHTAEVPDIGTVPVVRAGEPRRALALMAARFFGVQPETAVAVTGTSRPRCRFTAIFRAGHKSASLGIDRPADGACGSLTTPDPISLHETLAELAEEGVTHVAIEASSHGLDQHRLDGVRLKRPAPSRPRSSTITDN
jgi:UDP-N-acetylmuramoyl-L-alanyl-D-glutamate--2,6-diaminopimelate ligase